MVRVNIHAFDGQGKAGKRGFHNALTIQRSNAIFIGWKVCLPDMHCKDSICEKTSPEGSKGGDEVDARIAFQTR
jgi:hypothetical protein